MKIHSTTLVHVWHDTKNKKTLNYLSLKWTFSSKITAKKVSKILERVMRVSANNFADTAKDLLNILMVVSIKKEY